MNQRLEERLAELQREYEAGQKMIAELDAKRQNLQTTMLRIEGAIQVLREMLSQQGPAERASGEGGAGSAPPDSAK